MAGEFAQYFDNNVIEKIVCVGEYVKVGTSTFPNAAGEIMQADKMKFFGTCTIHFHNKPPKEWSSSFINFDWYNSQYGTPISADGSKLFIGSWEKALDGVKRGLRAYDIESDSLLWRLNEGKIRNIFVYSDYLIATQADASVLKVDINSGEVLGQVRSRAIEHAFDLGSPYILVDSIGSKLGVVDVEKMEVVKKYDIYKSKILNPSSCRSLVIQDAQLQDNILTVSGFEGCPPDDPYSIESTPFSRIMDSNFSTF